jgi:hypothetical protein
MLKRAMRVMPAHTCFRKGTLRRIPGCVRCIQLGREKAAWWLAPWTGRRDG